LLLGVFYFKSQAQSHGLILISSFNNPSGLKGL